MYKVPEQGEGWWRMIICDLCKEEGKESDASAAHRNKGMMEIEGHEIYIGLHVQLKDKHVCADHIIQLLSKTTGKDLITCELPKKG